MKILAQVSFAAAHYLPDHPKCGALHGHNYTVTAIVRTRGFFDFGILKAMLKEIVEEFDHSLLIPREDFDTWMRAKLHVPCELRLVSLDETTSECIAKTIFQKLRTALATSEEAKRAGAEINSVVVQETDRFAAEYGE